MFLWPTALGPESFFGFMLRVLLFKGNAVAFPVKAVLLLDVFFGQIEILQIVAMLAIAVLHIAFAGGLGCARHVGVERNTGLLVESCHLGDGILQQLVVGHIDKARWIG